MPKLLSQASSGSSTLAAKAGVRADVIRRTCTDRSRRRRRRASSAIGLLSGTVYGQGVDEAGGG